VAVVPEKIRDKQIKADGVKQRNIAVCHGPRCSDYGGRALAEQLMKQDMAFEILDCQSLCPHFPIVRIDGAVLHRASLEKVLSTSQHKVIDRFSDRN